MPSAPITGGVVKQDALKYPLSFDFDRSPLHKLALRARACQFGPILNDPKGIL